VTDIRFDLNTTESYNTISKEIEKAIFLVWAGLGHAIPSHLKLKSKANNHTYLTTLLKTMILML